MDPRKNPKLYERRARDVMLNPRVNNKDRWVKFFGNEKSDEEFKMMARRLALENKTEEEQIQVPKLNFAAIQAKFNSISNKLQGYIDSGSNLEGNRTFSQDVYELRLLITGREIPHASRRRRRSVPNVTISAMKREISGTVRDIQEILAFFGDGNTQGGAMQEKYDVLENRWDTLIKDEEWMESFMLRATPNPGNLQNQNQDDYALGVFNLMEAYNGIDALYGNDALYRQRLSQFCREIRKFKSYGVSRAPNPPLGPSRRRKRRRVDYYYY